MNYKEERVNGLWIEVLPQEVWNMSLVISYLLICLFLVVFQELFAKKVTSKKFSCQFIWTNIRICLGKCQMLKLLQVEVYLGIILRDVRKANHAEHKFSKYWWDSSTLNFIICPAEENILSQSEQSEFIFHDRNTLFQQYCLGTVIND